MLLIIGKFQYLETRLIYGRSYCIKWLPEKYRTNIPIEIGNLDELKLFHAGTNIAENELLTSGGRVFSLNYHASNLEDCVSYIYNKIDEIKFDGTIYRTDIGKIYES